MAQTRVRQTPRSPGDAVPLPVGGLVRYRDRLPWWVIPALAGCLLLGLGGVALGATALVTSPARVAGPVGPRGARGAQGPRGLTGVQGPAGPQGPVGPKGATVQRGPRVPRGLPVLRGYRDLLGRRERPDLPVRRGQREQKGHQGQPAGRASGRSQCSDHEAAGRLVGTRCTGRYHSDGHGLVPRRASADERWRRGVRARDRRESRRYQVVVPAQLEYVAGRRHRQQPAG